MLYVYKDIMSIKKIECESKTIATAGWAAGASAPGQRSGAMLKSSRSSHAEHWRCTTELLVQSSILCGHGKLERPQT